MGPKVKGAARKWISTACGEEVIVKDKLEHLTAFASYDLPEKKQSTPKI